MSTNQNSTRRPQQLLRWLVGVGLALALLGWVSTSYGIPLARAEMGSSRESLNGTATSVRSAASQSCDSKPAQPRLRAPEDGAFITKPQVTLKWDDVACEQSYQVRIIDVATNVRVYDVTLDADVLQFTPLRIGKGRTYNWFVKACNSFGCAKSETRQFTIAPVPLFHANPKPLPPDQATSTSAPDLSSSRTWLADIGEGKIEWRGRLHPS